MDTLVEAQSLLRARRFAGAAELLRPFAKARPGDPATARLLAQTLYWAGDRESARATFEAAVARHPGDVHLRLAYGRMLVEMSEGEAARTVLSPLLGTEASRGRAETLLGTRAYWDGDLAAARTLFNAALRADPSLAEASAPRREILGAALPRIDFAASALQDDQPLERLGAEAKGTAFITPLVSLTGRVEPIDFRVDGAPTVSILLAEGGIAAYVPAMRTELEAAGGWVQRTDSGSATGRVALGIRLPGRLRIRGSLERAPYLNTVASVLTPVMTQSAGVTLDWSHPRGWLAQGAGTSQRFPDANLIGSGSFWILAPVVHAEAVQLGFGYALSVQGSKESRYVLTTHVGDDGSTTTEGVYTPYYTPLDLRAHSVVANLGLRLHSRLTLRVAGAYGYAQESAPTRQRRAGLPTQPGSDVVTIVPRTFNPSNIRLSTDLRVGERLRLSAALEASRTAFYNVQSARIGLTRTFATPALRRLDAR